MSLNTGGAARVNRKKGVGVAIKQLDLLIKTKTMQSACQNDLFPMASCLLSQNLELGVPLRIEGEEMLTQ
uniref:Uncharacterized protein n=1 Tax=Timema cristinae TaxID=61476 RepID=A0A7R9CZE9_TIMCR|nr:unnamed protein product [Timema cristinae]